MKWILAATLALAACEGLGSEVTPDLERMIDQEKGEAYEPTPYLPNGRVMQNPPPGTVPRERVLGDPSLTEGIVNGRLLDQIPIPVDAALLARGRNRYDIYCAACHGLLGDGDSEVARRMELRRPPSLVDLPERLDTDAGNRYGPGGLFRTIRDGYGLMPQYSAELPPIDRWAVIAYLRALTVSQRSRFDELPPELKEDATRSLGGSR